MPKSTPPALRILKPFAHRDYAVLAGALALSTFAHGMWSVAMVYQVRHLGGGPTELSMVATATGLGLVLLVLLGGIMADRHSGRRILLLIEAASLTVMTVTAALSLTGALQLWHMIAAGFLSGAGMAFFFPSYSALLPRMLPAADLLAANGLEGTMRPVLHTALGPMAAGMIVASLSPAHAIAGIALSHLLALGTLLLISRNPAYDRPAHEEPDGIRAKTSMLHQLREGVSYTLKTPWLLWTLIFAFGAVLVFIGPVEVLIPFVVSDQLGGDARTFGFILAALGLGSAIGSIATASFRLPRRYLSVMIAAWALGSVPLVRVGFTDSFAELFSIMVVVGCTGAIGQVIWGTLLQRRVPPHLLGRISSLDFFVSLALMPISMALAGPLSEIVGIKPLFIIAGVAPPAFGFIAWFCGRLGRDELAHPLDHKPTEKQIKTEKQA